MDKEDRISSLPDGLLVDIISRIEIEVYSFYSHKHKLRLMSTKEVIRTTCIISKRWQRLWTLLPNLTFIEYDEGCLRTRADTKYLSFIDKTLIHLRYYAYGLKLNKFKLHLLHDCKFVTILPSQVNSWIHFAITRNVQEVDLKILNMGSVFGEGKFCYDDELFFNNSCITSMRISDCTFDPPNRAIRWDKLKCLSISYGNLDDDLVGEILSGSPFLETLELHKCNVVRRNLKSLIENFAIILLACGIETYKRFRDESYGDEYMSMELLRCEFNPNNVAIRADKLKFLCISNGVLDEDSIRKILSRSPCLETLELDNCYGIRRIEITSKRFKNLVLTNYGDMCPKEDYIDTMEINAPYMLSLTIKENLYLEKLLLLNMSSVVNADLDYLVRYRFADKRGVDEHEMREIMLRGLLPSLGHVKQIKLGDYCLDDLSRLKAKGFQFFRVGADGAEDRSTELTASGWKKVVVTVAAETKTEEKVKETVEFDDVSTR